MTTVVVADTGPLIALAKLQRLDLLRHSFSVVHVPHTVWVEATRDTHRPDAREISAFTAADPAFLQVVQDQETPLCSMLRAYLDEGETQAINLAKTLEAPVFMDERLGRQLARQISVPVVGLLGVLIHARQAGRILQLAPLLSHLQTAGYRISAELVAAALQRVGE